MERIPDDCILWRGKWQSTENITKKVAYGVIEIILKKDTISESSITYNTKAVVKYRGTYRTDGRDIIPVQVNIEKKME